MSQVLVNETSLTAIADAIREKNGETTTYKPSEMSDAISALTIGGSVDGEKVVITGDCSHMFQINPISDWVMDNFGHLISTNEISDAKSMFINSSITYVPFDINTYCYNPATSHDGVDLSYCFASSSIEKAPKINNKLISGDRTHSPLNRIFADCQKLTDVSEAFINFNWDAHHNIVLANTLYNHDELVSMDGMFKNTVRLRSIPTELLQELYLCNGVQTKTKRNYMFENCVSLDELIGFPLVNYDELFHTFYNVGRLKNLTFTNQCSGVNREITIDLSKYVGYVGYVSDYLAYLPTTGRITNDTTYQQYKDNVDSWTSNYNYSRYNRLSAIATLESLPQAQNGPCEIIFKGDSGAKTDGGAINTMTPEEIAIATAKDWTVSFV